MCASIGKYKPLFLNCPFFERNLNNHLQKLELPFNTKYIINVFNAQCIPTKVANAEVCSKLAYTGLIVYFSPLCNVPFTLQVLIWQLEILLGGDTTSKDATHLLKPFGV